MKKKIIITYNWQHSDGLKKTIKPSHQSVLEESAMNRITEQFSLGFTSGELHDNIKMLDDDGENGIEYSGWFDITKK